MSQALFAAYLGVHRNSVNRWEGGLTGIDLWDFLRVASVLEVQPELLLPAEALTLGALLKQAKGEAFPPKKPVQSERDPRLLRNEARRLMAPVGEKRA